MSTYKYKRVLLKLSGEALQGSHGYGIDPQVVTQIASEVKEVATAGIELAIVVGGGNIFRGLAGAANGMDRVQADYIGMLATVMNALALQESLERIDIDTRVQTAITMQELAEPYIKRRATRHLEKGRVVIFACGTGNPYFTTDTTAALRACEIGAQAILKATQVDGVYSADPKKHSNSELFDTISYLDVLNRDLRVMDSTAVSLCKENNLPIIVFNLHVPGNIMRILKGEHIGTVITGSENNVTTS